MLSIVVSYFGPELFYAKSVKIKDEEHRHYRQQVPFLRYKLRIENMKDYL